MHRYQYFLPLFVALSFGAAAIAEDRGLSDTIDIDQLKPTNEKEPGWHNSADLDMNFSVNSSENVIGQTDGTSETYGLGLKASFVLLKKYDEWRNNFMLQEATTKTPSIPRFVKSSDELKIETLYMYFMDEAKSWGPYVRAEVSTALFPGEDVRPEEKTYVIDYTSRPDEVVTLTSLRLTEGLRPLTTKESLGAFWKISQTAKFVLEARLGLGAVQVKADGQLAVIDENDSGHILVEELESYSQFGVETALQSRYWLDKKTKIEAGVETLTPLSPDLEAGDNRSEIRLTNVDAFLKLTSKLTTWASFGYDYHVRIQPQLVDRAQTTHKVVLTVNYSLL